MGQCKYCGGDAGFFSHVHKQCENLHEQGISILEEGIRKYFRDSIKMNTLLQIVASVKQENFVTDPDIAISSAKCIDEYTEKSHWPFHSHQLDLVRDYVNLIGVPYQSINVNGSLDNLCQKMLRGFLAEYFTGQKSLQRVMQIINQILSVLPMPSSKKQDTYTFMLNQAADNYLKDGLLTDDEQKRMDDFANTLSLNLPATIEQNKMLKQLQQGIVPRTNFHAPILLGKDEVVLWCYDGVTMYQEKVKREMVGSHSGFSFRVMKGVTYRTGGFKGHPVEHSYMDNAGTGSLYITNKHIIFHSSVRSTKIPYKKIIGLNPYQDGMGVQQDGANAKKLVFQGFDCSFVLNIMSFISV
ncbi:MAG: hypothetical protein J5965_14865 [Aeriscardovia sp.]|nr:hypothetical protein [Aeriscardovia sp.]